MGLRESTWVRGGVTKYLNNINTELPRSLFHSVIVQHVSTKQNRLKSTTLPISPPVGFLQKNVDGWSDCWYH